MPNESPLLSTIRAEMARRGLTQKQLAEAAGMKHVALSDRLRGATPMRVDELYRIAAALNVRVSALVDDEQVSA